MILSVSRRTDIPAFYSQWFMERLKAGYVLVRNPYNYHQLSKIPLSPNNVDCIVFWTKNSQPIHKYLESISNMGYNFYFQYTITPYHNDIETNLNNKKNIVKSFQELSSKIGKEKVLLRYDPVLINERYSIKYHTNAFNILCSQLAGSTEKVIFSFIDNYKSMEKNKHKLNLSIINQDIMETLAYNLAKTAQENNMMIETCAEGIELEKYGIKHGACIDYDLIEKIIHKPLKKRNSKGTLLKDGTRTYCQCLKCIDIGEYGSCKFNCLYCYADSKYNNQHKIYKTHNKYSPLLLGEIEQDDKIIERPYKHVKSIIESKNILDYL